MGGEGGLHVTDVCSCASDFSLLAPRDLSEMLYKWILMTNTAFDIYSEHSAVEYSIKMLMMFVPKSEPQGIDVKFDTKHLDFNSIYTEQSIIMCTLYVISIQEN